MYNSPEYQSIINIARTYIKEIADPQYDINQPGVKELGAGDAGQTVMGKDKDSAIKRPIEGGRGRIGRHEMKAMEKMDGIPGFPRLLQKDVKERSDGTFEGKIAMDLAKGDTIRNKSPMMPQDKRHEVFKKIIRLRRDMHKKGIAHNDMHAENIFVDDDYNPTLIDFGEANVDPLAALGEALGFTNELMPTDIKFDGAMKQGGENKYDMRDPEMMKLLQGNHKKVMSQLESIGEMSDDGDIDEKGRTEFEKFMLFPHGNIDGDRNYDELKNDVGELTNERIYELIDTYYNGVDDNTPATRMGRAVGNLKNIKKRISRGGNLRKGEVSVPDENLDD